MSMSTIVMLTSTGPCRSCTVQMPSRTHAHGVGVWQRGIPSGQPVEVTPPGQMTVDGARHVCLQMTRNRERLHRTERVRGGGVGAAHVRTSSSHGSSSQVPDSARMIGTSGDRMIQALASCRAWPA